MDSRVHVIRSSLASLVFTVVLAASPAAAQWTRIEDVPAQGVAFVRSFGDTLVAGTISHAYVSTDAGATWQPSAPLPSGAPLAQTLLVRDGVLYVGTARGGVLRSADLGQSWQPFNGGLVGGIEDSQLDVSDLVMRGDSLYASTFGAGVYVRNLAATDTWHHFGEEFEPNQASNVRSLALDGTRLIAAAGGNGSIFFRDPGDADWTVSWLDNVGLHPGLQAFGAVSTGTGVVVATGAGQRVFSSAHGEVPWAIVNLGLGLLDSEVLTTRGHIVFGAFNRVNDVVFGYSEDNGLSWEGLDDLPGVQVFHMTTLGTDLYAGRSDGLFRRSIATVSVPVASTTSGLRLAIAGAQPVVSDARLRFELPEAGDATIDVFDVSGRRAARVVQPSLAPGPHEVTLAAHDLAPGIYAVRLVAGSRAEVVRLVRVR